MASSSREYEPPVPGPLQLRDSVRSALYSLRHFTQVTLDSLSPPKTLAAPELDLSLVVSVEEALWCSLPDEILACLANDDDVLDEVGFGLGEIADHTQFARKRGCPRDLVAVGCDPDFHAFFCVSREGPRHREVQIADRDNFDGNLRWYDLATWLARKVEDRREFLCADYPALAEWQPSPDELSAFKPALVE